MAPYKGVDFLCTVGLWGFQAVSVYTIVGAILRSGGVKALLWVIGFLGALTSVRRWDDSTQSLAQGRFRWSLLLFFFIFHCMRIYTTPSTGRFRSLLRSF
ncbi:hypothetical protein J3E72DRAFT_278099 [Bipolaris maydis]|nr:hypothetical protein J3E73DRAFT_301303 [Bipolaris maydis]KAJ5059137.1 hypothetical protein J3E74DRAFT_355744 [Bipolaris maydis]KAJ6202719.1 hypothetical protein J3E72DRAFT_278099 [Bipolaris maydis]KAJ6209125.1 hypothetical protein PSV09DRAFT_2315470 [Bipolaris maydis]